MKKHFLCSVFFLIFRALCFSQSETVLFSVSGDTVCRISLFGQSESDTSIRHTVYIFVKDSHCVARPLSMFDVICRASNHCLEALSPDTLRKYHLYDDATMQGLWKDIAFQVSVKPANIRKLDSLSGGPKKFIYQATLHVYVTFEQHLLYDKQFEFQFKGNSPEDFSSSGIVHLDAKKKKNTIRHFFQLSVKEKQVILKQGGYEDYSFSAYLFIL